MPLFKRSKSKKKSPDRQSESDSDLETSSDQNVKIVKSDSGNINKRIGQY